MPGKRFDHPTVGHTEKEVYDVKNKSSRLGLTASLTNHMEKNEKIFSLLRNDKRTKGSQNHNSKISISMLSTQEKALIEFPL